MFKILVCEEFIGKNLDKLFAGYEIDVASTSEEILEKTYTKKYNLYIINFDFYNTIEELKRFDDTTPTIFIDNYYDIFHIKKSFEIGDEYIIKPVNLEELDIRINYYYKKLYSKKQSILTYKDMFFHTRSKQLYINNQKVKLSPNDTTLLELFLSNQGKNILKYNLMDELNSTSDGALRVYISKLKKLGLDIEFDRATNSYKLK